MYWFFEHLPKLPPLEMAYGRDASECYKVFILLGALLLLGAWRFLPRRASIVMLVLLTTLSVVNYMRLSNKLLFERVDTYDLIHYYLNTRYFDELGYFNLYPAIVRVDVDNGGPFFRGGVQFLDQDETGHHLQPISVALKKGVETKKLFSPEQWSTFSHDFLHLQRKMKGLDDETWTQMLNDHGYNGTVVWTMIARPIAELVPVEHVKWLGMLDVLMLAGAVGAVAWAYGGVPALWATFFLFTTYSTRWPTISWAFLRYDYVSALVVAMCLLKKGKPLLAGVLTGYAATLRLFPAMWLYGPGAKGISLLVGKKLHRPALVLLMGFLLGAGVLQAAATLEFGTEQVVTHFENMEDHNKSENISSRRIGLALALVYNFHLLPKIIDQPTKMVMENQRPIRYGLAAFSMAVLGWGLRKRRDDEAYAFGFLPFFLLTTASYYYYIARLPLIVMHAAGMGDPTPPTEPGWKGKTKAILLGPTRHHLGLAWLLFLEMFCNWAETEFPRYRFFLIGWLAWGLFAYTIGMAIWYFLGDYLERSGETGKPVEGIPDMQGVGGG